MFSDYKGNNERSTTCITRNAQILENQTAHIKNRWNKILQGLLEIF